MDTLGNMYAFGATLGYSLVFVSIIKLRFSDPYSPRPFKMPINLPWKTRDGRTVDVPILGFIGLLGVSSILFMVILTHAIGRIAGPAWVLCWLLFYLWYRRRKGRPMLGSIKHDWEKEQMDVLTSAEEYDLLEQYTTALMVRDRVRLREKNHPEKPHSP